MAPIISGQIANVDEKGRLTFPADVLRALVWWRDETIDVIVEVHRKGQLRIFEAGAVKTALGELEVDAHSEGGEVGLARRAVLVDRYRRGVLYKERRIQLVREIASILDVELGVKAQTFAQPFKHWIEVSTLEVRHSRLEDYNAFAALDVDRLFPDG